MKKLVRLLVVAFVAGAVATIIVQRDRLRQIDREQLAGQIRDAIQSRLPKGSGDEGTVEAVAEEVAAAAEEAVEAAEAVVAEAEDDAGEASA